MGILLMDSMGWPYYSFDCLLYITFFAVLVLFLSNLSAFG